MVNDAGPCGIKFASDLLCIPAANAADKIGVPNPALTESKQMKMNIALIAGTYPKGSPDLMTVLHKAHSQGADLALLPELP